MGKLIGEACENAFWEARAIALLDPTLENAWAIQALTC